MRLRFLQAIILVGACASAQAQEDAPSGWYGSISLGPSHFSHACRRCENSDLAFRLALGYEVNDRLAVEGGLADLGRTTSPGGFGSGASISAQAIDVSAVASWPIGERLFLQGRLGLYAGALQSRSGGFDLDEAAVGAGGVTLGLGTRYDFTDHFAGRLEWQRYVGLGEGDIDVVSAGVLFRF